MTILPVIIAPDPRLKVTCPPVDGVNDEVRRLMDDMLETMRAAPGVGLAAPQVGVLKRIIVLDLTREGDETLVYKLVNPEIVWSSEDLNVYEEGCLSLPDHFAEATRPAEVRFRYVDEQNGQRELEASGLLATCVQHEMDHLDGTLFIDHLSLLRRNIILRKLVKTRKQKASA